jgi:hypothetical protein
MASGPGSEDDGRTSNSTQGLQATDQRDASTASRTSVALTDVDRASSSLLAAPPEVAMDSVRIQEEADDKPGTVRILMR